MMDFFKSRTRTQWAAFAFVCVLWGVMETPDIRAGRYGLAAFYLVFWLGMFFLSSWMSYRKE